MTPNKRAAQQAAYYKAHKTEMATYYKAHKTERAAYLKTHKTEITARDAAYRKTHQTEITAQRAAYHKTLKQTILNAYGGTQCVCCGETEIAFLSLDHINGGGNAHRKTVGRGSGFYRWLKKHNFPKEPPLRVLCMNCQFGRKNNHGMCPHLEVTGS